MSLELHYWVAFIFFCIFSFIGPNIITQARPGNEFVSIDGKRTYFDIGPTISPQPQGGGFVRPQQNVFNNQANNIHPQNVGNGNQIQHPNGE